MPVPCTVAVHCVEPPVTTPAGLQLTVIDVIAAPGVDELAIESGAPQPAQGTTIAQAIAIEMEICAGKILSCMILAERA